MTSHEKAAPGPTTPLLSERATPVVVATVLAMCLLVFVGLALRVRDDGAVAFDEPVMLWLHSVSTPWLSSIVQAVTHGGGQVVLVVAVVIAAVLCALRRWADALIVLAAEVGASQLNVALKPVFDRSRPDFWEHPTVENTPSFPSGHTMGAMSIAAPLVVLAWNTRYRWPVLIVAGGYAFAVGASRVYLGVHYPSDVIAGWCLTVLVVAIVVAVVRRTASVTHRAWERLDIAVPWAPTSSRHDAPPDGAAAGLVREDEDGEGIRGDDDRLDAHEDRAGRSGASPLVLLPEALGSPAEPNPLHDREN